MAKNTSSSPKMVVSETRNLKFKQYPEIGKTICTLKGDEFAFINLVTRLIEENSEHLEFCLPYPIKGGVTEIMHENYTATAKVNFNDGDTYNESVGKSIAKEKAVSKFHRELNQKLVGFYTELVHVMASVEHYMDKHKVDYSNAPTVSDVKCTKYADAYMARMK